MPIDLPEFFLKKNLKNLFFIFVYSQMPIDLNCLNQELLSKLSGMLTG